MSNYFKSKSYISDGFIINDQQQKLDMRTLPPILRVLLSTDGTVTKTLEAYYWEPIQVLSVKQEEIILNEPCPYLPTQAGEQVLKRSVELVGQTSQRCYTKADSLIRLQHLPTNIRQQLIEGHIGIGELLRESQLETYRQLVNLGQINNADIFRMYQIIIDHRPTLLVTEYFPRACYQE
jgi:chorismate-pyruvate lyase